MERLKIIREKKGLTQTQAAEQLNISRVNYNRYENGEREPDNATLIKLAQFFNVSTDFLLGNVFYDNSPEMYPYKDEPLPNHTERPATSSEEEVSPADLELARKIKNLPPEKRKAIEILVGPDEQAAGVGN